jgi:hypothetical protein
MRNKRSVGLNAMTRSLGLQAREMFADASARLLALRALEMINLPDLPHEVKLRLVNPLVRAALDIANYRVGELRENEALLAEANRKLREEHPELINENFAYDLLLGTYREEIEEVIKQTILDDLIHDGSISITLLLRANLLDAAMERLAEECPYLEVKKGFDKILLDGPWAEEIEAAIEDISNRGKNQADCSKTSPGPGDTHAQTSEKEVG